MFEIRNLKYKNILDIPYLRIDRQVTCIRGNSGSGKTTLLRHLNRLSEPDEGEILYGGTPLTRMSPVELRRKVVMLGQTPVLYDGTVADNLQAGLHFSQKPAAGRREMAEILERVGLNKNPEDWCDKLSGGEKQRLCLARVLLMEAETYLMDEPSAALDKETEGFIMDNLADFVTKGGRSLVLVTHSEQAAKRFEGSVIRIGNGRAEGYEE